MENQYFKALLVSETADHHFTREIITRQVKELPIGDILVQVRYSSLNYKDGLSASGNKGVTRKYPHTPGIDAAGIVAESSNDNFHEGDEVIVMGYDLGMNRSGGFGQFIRVPADWVVMCPSGLSLFESMIYGTAGFTAAQSVLKLIEHPTRPQQGKILVSGVTGGVGSVSGALLAKLGYEVVGVSGKPDALEFLENFGVHEIISRDEATDKSGRLLLKTKWAGVIDTVGGEILATSLKSTKYGGGVTCCGNVASPELATTVYPFILRGISLYGIDSGNCTLEIREQIWRKLASEWKIDLLDNLVREIGLDELDQFIDLILQGKTKGRIVVNMEQ
jgi:putative YhdH/YhfP family quinone oxidoreductase